MKVRATMKGFYDNQIRKEGETFTLKKIEVSKDGKRDIEASKKATDSQFSDKWMEKLSKPGPKPREPAITSLETP